MLSYEVKNFNAGLDVRRDSMNAPAGTLRKLTNAVITSGGEIVKVLPFTLFATAPADTIGVMGDQNYIYTVRSGGSAVAAGPTTLGIVTIPAGVSFNLLADYERWAGLFYVVVHDYVTPQWRHFYNGAEVLVGDNSSNVKLHRRKMYRLGGDGVVRFSVSGDPATLVDQAPPSTLIGAGSFSPPEYDSEMTDPQGIEIYYSDIAILSAYASQIWAIDANPSANQYKQTLRQAGTIAPRSVKQYGSGDVLYLAADGVRSLRARDESLAASVSDIGSPLDPIMLDIRRDRGIASYMSRAISVLEPYSGRFWLIFPDRIFILTAFPTPKITAWSEVVPGFLTGGVTITSACVGGDKVTLRDSNNKIWIYGDYSGPARVSAFADRGPDIVEPFHHYGTDLVEVEFPFLSMDKPAVQKTFVSLDVAAQGDWDIYAAFNPDNPTAEEYLGHITGSTFPARRFALNGYGTHCSLRFRHASADHRALLSSVVFHFRASEKD